MSQIVIFQCDNCGTEHKDPILKQGWIKTEDLNLARRVKERNLSGVWCSPKCLCEFYENNGSRK